MELQTPSADISGRGTPFAFAFPLEARYGPVVVVGWIGLMKFTGYEAEGICPFVGNSIPNVRLRVALSMQRVSHESLGPSFPESEEVAQCFDRTE
jgi:hypothetical protein